MRYIDQTITNQDDARALVQSTERAFSASLDNAVEAIVRHHTTTETDGMRIITLSGPTCSGKTTTARRLIRRITEAGYHAVVLSIDDFFLDRARTNDVSTARPDYDTVKAIDLDAFASCVEGLQAGRPTLIPHYDFPTGKRDSYAEYSPTERDIYVFEGIQAVYPEVVRCFGGANRYRSIFIHVAEDVSFHGTVLTSDEIRLLRRIVRDYKFRSAHPEFTLFLWENVRENEKLNIYPNAASCDVYIDSFLPYELYYIAAYAIPLLEEVPSESVYRARARELCEKIAPFHNPNFEENMIPADSVFREFIGG